MPHELAQAFVVLLELQNLGQLELRVFVEAPGVGRNTRVKFLSLVGLGLRQQRVAEHDARLVALLTIGVFFQVSLQFVFGCCVVLHGLCAVSLAEYRRSQQISLGEFLRVGGQNFARLGEFFGESQSGPLPVVRRLGQIVLRIFFAEFPEGHRRLLVAFCQQLREALQEKRARRLIGRRVTRLQGLKGGDGFVILLGALLGRAAQIKHQREAFR